MKKILGHVIDWHDSTLLKQALTHRSVGYKNNERLEFLGDAVLDTVVSEWLYCRFPELSEGKLSQLRAQLVNGRVLAEIARYYGLGGHIKLGGGEIKSGGADKKSVLADAVEATLGAHYLDQGYDRTKVFILSVFEPWLEKIDPFSINRDSKSLLQELLQKNGYQLPQYEVLQTIASDMNNTDQFHIKCYITELNLVVNTENSSRKKAEQDAAYMMLDKLAEKGIQ